MKDFYLCGVLVALLVFLSGCTSIIEPYVATYEEGMQYADPRDRALYDADAYPACREGTCECYICENNTARANLLSRALGLARSSFEGGTCYFQPDCNEAKLTQIRQDPVATLRPFLIGQGSNFVDFMQAEKYCKNRLDMPVKWLYARGGADYPVPQSDRATCFLRNGLQPMYILYRPGGEPSVAGARAVAQALQDTGPSIIVSEMDFDSSSATHRINVGEQVKAMKQECPKCLIALGVKMGDYNALTVLDDPDVKSKVDLVAFGINTHFSKMRCDLEDAPDVSVARLFSGEVYPFVEKIRYDYEKSIIIPYVLYDVGPNGFDPTVDQEQFPKGPCLWNEMHVAEAQDFLFTTALPVLSGQGVIGAAPYSYIGDENPLNCNDCALVERRDPATGEPDITKERFLNWFAFCQAFKTNTLQLPSGTEIPSGDYLAVYATQPGTVCTLAHNNYQFYHQVLYQQGPVTQEARRPDLEAAAPFPAFACESCVNEMPEFPFDLGREADPTHADLQKFCNGQGDPAFIEITNAIDRFAELRDLDPMLVRAIIWKESGFNRCTASTVPDYGPGVGGAEAGCNPFDIDNAPLETSGDPDEGTILQDPSGRPNACTFNPLVGPNAGRKFCAYGLMQTIWYPGYVFEHFTELQRPAADAGWEELTQCAAELGLTSPGAGRSPALRVNPFEPSHSVCLGTLEFSKYVPVWQAYVNDPTRASDLEIAGDTLEAENKRNIMAIYFALHRYFGDVGWVQGKIDDFVAQKIFSAAGCGGDTPPPICTNRGYVPVGASPDACLGNRDFINYVTECWAPYAHPNRISQGTDGDYGARVLARYETLRTGCSNSNCPSYGRLLTQANTERVAGGRTEVTWPPPPGTTRWEGDHWE